MKKIFFTTIFLLLIPLNASAVGISVTPSSLEVETTVDQEYTAVLKVTNGSIDVSLFEAYVDNFDDFISVRPASFILESGEQKTVFIIISAEKEQVSETNISIISRPVTDSAFNASGGVKIPITINISDGEVSSAQTGSIGLFMTANNLILFCAIVLGALGAVFLFRSQKKS